MRREVWDKIVECADCGLPVDVSRERGYQGAGEWALCWSCAIDRGAAFDEEEDRWLVAPDSSGLPVEELHKER